MGLVIGRKERGKESRKLSWKEGKEENTRALIKLWNIVAYEVLCNLQKISKMLTMQCSVKESSVHSLAHIKLTTMQKQSMCIISIRKEFYIVKIVEICSIFQIFFTITFYFLNNSTKA